jgi:hypothetical protein
LLRTSKTGITFGAFLGSERNRGVPAGREEMSPQKHHEV